MFRKIIRTARASYLYLEAVWQLDAVLAAIVRRSPSRLRNHHVLLAATGGGNIGDQAMLESFLQHANGSLNIVTSARHSLNIPAVHLDRVTVHEIPRLITGLPVLRLTATLRLMMLLKGARTYSVIGADIMDGVYSPEQSVARISSLNCATKMGVSSRILGFSWSPNAGSSAKLAMRRISKKVRILARDPHSLQRLTADGIGTAELVTDTVFSLESVKKAEPTVLREWIRAQKAVNRKIAVLNASGLISRKIDLTPDYSAIVSHLRASGYSVLLLPHVIRPGDDDSEPTDVLAESWVEEGSDVFKVDTLLAPSEVKSVVSEADIVISGRMHLAVLALSTGVPTITFGTQGKVEGLYSMFNLERFCLNPETGVGNRAIAIIDELRSNSEIIHETISAALPQIFAASLKNFDDLDQV